MRTLMQAKVQPDATDLTDFVNNVCTALEIPADGLEMGVAQMRDADGRIVPRASNGFQVLSMIKEIGRKGEFDARDAFNITAQEFERVSSRAKRKIARELCATFDSALRQKLLLPETKETPRTIVHKLERALNV